MTSIFCSVRLGVSSAHRKANMIGFNYFDEAQAFARDSKTWFYKVDFGNLVKVTNSHSELILTLQGDGNYTAIDQLA